MNEILEQSLLYDFYGELLTDKQREIYEQYILDDLSLKEIADEMQITRQGIHETIKRSLAALYEYEGKLHLVEKFLSIKNNVKEINLLISQMKETEETDRIKSVLDEILREL